MRYNKHIQINETKIREIVSETLKNFLKESFENNSIDIIEQVVNNVIENHGDDIDDFTSTNEIRGYIEDAYISLTGIELTDRNLYRIIAQKIGQRIWG